MGTAFFPIGALQRGKIVDREAWGDEKVMKLVKPEEWDGLFEIGHPMIMVKTKAGCSQWDKNQEDILATDWRTRDEKVPFGNFCETTP